MLAVSSATLGYAGVAAPLGSRTMAPVMETVSDLKDLSSKLNPAVGFWEPIGLMANVAETEEATVGWFRRGTNGSLQRRKQRWRISLQTLQISIS